MKIGDIEVTNPLEVIKCIIAFDSKDYATDTRDRMLYAIVFGWDCYEEFGWNKETIKEYKKLHKRFEELAKVEFKGE